MALRYTIDVEHVDYRPQTDLRVIPATRRPEVVEFTREANTDKLAIAILRRSMTDVCAAVGAGKSTRLPISIAKQKSGRVYLAVPNVLLAVHIYDFLLSSGMARREGVELMLVTDSSQRVSSEILGPQLICISTSQLIARVLKTQAGCLQSTTVFLDEAHESDAYSYVLRNSALQLGASHVIRASATFSPDSFKPRYTPSSVEKRVYPPTPVSQWNVRDPSKPWYFAQDHNILVYIDSRTEANALAEKYRSVGCTVHILRAWSSVSDFRKAVEDTKDEDVLTVLLLDYSFRSGFTFEACTILDTGYMRYMSAQVGLCEQLERPLYAFEAEQTAGRLGRLPNMNAVYYRPEGELECKRTDLEGVELEAAAYLYRLLGFRPLHVLDHAIMAHKNLPRSATFQDAMNGSYPLTYYLQKSAGDDEHGDIFVEDELPPVEEESQESETVRSISRERRPYSAAAVGAEPTGRGRRRMGGNGRNPSVVPPSETISIGSCRSRDASVADPAGRGGIVGNDVLDQWASCLRTGVTGGEYNEIEEGKFYYPTYIPLSIFNSECKKFPEGIGSVTDYFGGQLDDFRRVRDALTEFERQYALALLSRQYNVAVTECKAAREALVAVSAELSFDPAASDNREKVRAVHAEISKLDSERSMLCRLLTATIKRTEELCQFDGFPDFLRGRTQAYRVRLKEILQPRQRISADEYSRVVQSAVDSVHDKPLGALSGPCELHVPDTSYSITNSSSRNGSGGSSSNNFSFRGWFSAVPVVPPLIFSTAPASGSARFQRVSGGFIPEEHSAVGPVTLVASRRTASRRTAGRGWNPYVGYDTGPPPPRPY